MHNEPTLHDPTTQPPPPIALSETCDCERPIPQARAERKGAARTYCARCGRPVPLTIGGPPAWR